MPELIASRALAGIGGGGFNTLSAVLISDIVPLQERGLWQGYRNLVFAVGLGVGALGETESLKSKLKSIDFGGAISIIIAISTLLLGLDHGSTHAWNSAPTIWYLLTSLIAFETFIFIEFRIATSPFAPSFILSERTLLACSFCNFFAYSAQLSTTYYLPLYWQAAEGLTATQAALRLLPGIAAGVIGSLISGWVMLKTGKYFLITLISYITFVFGIVPLILFTGWATGSLWGIWLGTVVCGFALNVGSTSTLVALITVAGPEHQAVAISCLHLFRSLGSEMGLALSAVVIQQVLGTKLHAILGDKPDASTLVKKLTQDLKYLNTLEPEIRGKARLAYEVAVRWSFVLCLCLATGSLFASLFIREKKKS
ncbi:hypothetical protein P7C71_g4692, partial [Lecanoromycetidae sp. Uapishka_2]